MDLDCRSLESKLDYSCRSACCRRQGYEVLERFHEEGESAKTTDRSQLQNLLTFCRLNKGRVHFVIVFNLTRFARDSTTTSRCARICNRSAPRCRRRESRSMTRRPTRLLEGSGDVRARQYACEYE